jgi:predicted RNA polymerase sigma factor
VPLDSNAETLLRELTPQVLGAVMRRFGDFAAAEDAVQEALIAAAMQWPGAGLTHPPLHVLPFRTESAIGDRADAARRGDGRAGDSRREADAREPWD